MVRTSQEVGCPPGPQTALLSYKHTNEILHSAILFKTLLSSQTEADAFDSVDCTNYFCNCSQMFLSPVMPA